MAAEGTEKIRSASANSATTGETLLWKCLSDSLLRLRGKGSFDFAKTPTEVGVFTTLRMTRPRVRSR